MGASAPHQVTCPQCQRTDRVQAVSAIVSAGTQTGHFLAATSFVGSQGGLGMTSGRNTQQTLLAQRLAPPPAPHKPRWGPWSLIILILAGVAGFFGCGLSTFLLVATVHTNSPGWIAFMSSGYWVLLVALLVSAPVVAWHSYQVARWRKQLPQEQAQWQQAMTKWQQLYYCARDDGVFLPGKTTLIPVGMLQQWLAQHP